MNTIREIQRLNERELRDGVPPEASWHNDYKDSAFIFIGSLPYELTEGDILTIFSQYGVPVFIKLGRDKTTGKSRGFAFLKYEDQRSTILAVDNLNGVKILNRTIRVDHTVYKAERKRGEGSEEDGEDDGNYLLEDIARDSEESDGGGKEKRKRKRRGSGGKSGGKSGAGRGKRESRSRSPEIQRREGRSRDEFKERSKEPQESSPR